MTEVAPGHRGVNFVSRAMPGCLNFLAAVVWPGIMWRDRSAASGIGTPAVVRGAARFMLHGDMVIPPPFRFDPSQATADHDRLQPSRKIPASSNNRIR
ncbi:conserved protein of unknown function (plasmid) [Rhodovastum atsumiense]|uniref:Uncharacterized protein n=1 Tax=Rhodovastum atsumiense TaxID=504468 RepID=A0A5M6IJC8_9PROT|nr:hypothetical protein [Rhodovastum atsumiense]KAA5608376.1 hypothetical protein F1189_29340 [Rhodovastum atsumiense]CAH2605633.1 conserved protein of unknown function [Rhodovastum atsumiense]